MNEKPISVLWQMIAQLSIPTGLYAFKRIKKLTFGIGIYAILFVSMVLVSAFQLGYWNWLYGDINNVSKEEVDGTYFIIMGIFYVFSIFLPMVFVRKWSIEYNKKIEKVKTIF